MTLMESKLLQHILWHNKKFKFMTLKVQLGDKIKYRNGAIIIQNSRYSALIRRTCNCSKLVNHDGLYPATEQNRYNRLLQSLMAALEMI